MPGQGVAHNNYVHVHVQVSAAYGRPQCATFRVLAPVIHVHVD